MLSGKKVNDESNHQDNAQPTTSQMGLWHNCKPIADFPALSQPLTMVKYSLPSVPEHFLDIRTMVV